VPKQSPSKGWRLLHSVRNDINTRMCSNNVMGINTLNTCVILSERKIPYMFNLFEPLQVQNDSAFQGFFVASAASLPSLLRMTR